MPCHRTSTSRLPHADALEVRDLGRMAYGPCLELQRRLHAQVVAGGPPVILLVEHDPVITVTRRAAECHVLLAPGELARRGIETCPTDRGGDVTYHGPGQLVVYPILRLTDLGLNVGRYVRLLERAVIAAVASFGVAAGCDAQARGVWVCRDKLCAIGVRVSRNVTLHGLALNVTTRLEDFAAIVPCGLRDRGVTSLQRLLGSSCPGLPQVKAALVGAIQQQVQAAALARQ